MCMVWRWGGVGQVEGWEERSTRGFGSVQGTGSEEPANRSVVSRNGWQCEWCSRIPTQPWAVAQRGAWSPGKRAAILGSPPGSGRNIGARESSLRTQVEFQGGWVPLLHRHLRLKPWAGRDERKRGLDQQVLCEKTQIVQEGGSGLGQAQDDGVLIGNGLRKVVVCSRIQLLVGLVVGGRERSALTGLRVAVSLRYWPRTRCRSGSEGHRACLRLLGEKEKRRQSHGSELGGRRTLRWGSAGGSEVGK